MTPFQAVVLSLVQAVTEFLPISSSGHLILVPYFLGWPDQGLSFDVAAHFGTMLAVVAYFRHELVDLVTGFFTGSIATLNSFGPSQWIAWATRPDDTRLNKAISDQIVAMKKSGELAKLQKANLGVTFDTPSSDFIPAQ